MLLRRGTCVLASAAALAAAAPASAGIFSWIGRDVAGGAMEKIEPSLARAIADVDLRVSKQEGQIEAISNSLVYKVSQQAAYRLDQVGGILEQRILQLQVGADEVLDHGLDRLDDVAKNRLRQADAILARRIDQVSSVAEKRLDQADGILKERIADVRTAVTGAISQADDAVAARIRQVDEVAGRRLGNVDVIATKQRLGLETTITRAAWIVALVVFVVLLLRALGKEYVRIEAQIADGELGKDPKDARAWIHARALGARLLQHAVVGAVVAALLAVVPGLLPMTASKELAAVTGYHTTSMQRALADLDFVRVSFHASQLELLQPPDAARYRAMSAKADLLRDLLGRPTALATASDASAMLEQVQALERFQVGRPDPDGQTVRALIAWQQGSRRADMRRAATLATRALWGNPRGFTLAPLASLLVQAYLAAPCPVLGDESATEAADFLDSEATSSMVAAVRAAGVPLPGSPFEGAVTLFDLMNALRAVSDSAFVAMVDAQVQVQLSKGSPGSKERAAALERRNQFADQIIQAWKTFDSSLAQNRALSNNPLVLSIFRLNDAILSHALWYAAQPDTTDWPKAMADLKGPQERAVKLAMAPARLIWARRHGDLLRGAARQLIEWQEANRFLQMEAATLAFEESYAAYARLANAPKAPQKTEALIRLARAGTGLGLYLGNDSPPGASAPGGPRSAQPGLLPSQGRTPFAMMITGGIAQLRQEVHAVTEPASAEVSRKHDKPKGPTRDELAESVDRLREQLLSRGASSMI